LAKGYSDASYGKFNISTQEMGNMSHYRNE
jgi:hypothetical protein